MLMSMMMSCKLVQIWNTRFFFIVTTMMVKSSIGECIKIQILLPKCFHQVDVDAEFEDDHLLADRGPDRLWKTNARNILWMFSHWRFCNHPISYLCTSQPLIIHWETQNIFMPYFLVLSSAETVNLPICSVLVSYLLRIPFSNRTKPYLFVKQIHISWKTNPCHLSSVLWYTTGEDDNKTLQSCVNGFLFGHKNKGWPQLSKPMCANPVKVLGKFKWTLLKQIFLFFWKYLTVICPGPHLPKTKPCPICSCFMDHL